MPNPDTRVGALHEDGERKLLYIGGEFTKIGASSRNGLARIGQVVDPDVIFYDPCEFEQALPAGRRPRTSPCPGGGRPDGDPEQAI
jgi:hypothetical protein